MMAPSFIGLHSLLILENHFLLYCLFYIAQNVITYAFSSIISLFFLGINNVMTNATMARIVMK